jgi:hypothetical protein
MQQIRNFLEGAMFDKLVDAIAKITQSTFGTLDIRKCGLIGDYAFQAFCVDTHVREKNYVEKKAFAVALSKGETRRK